MTKGFILSITADVVKNLEAADKAVKEIGENSEKTRDMVNNAFQQMTTGGVQEFINKLTEAKTAIAAIGSSDVQFNGVVNISTQAVEASDKVVGLVDTLRQLREIMNQQTGGSISIGNLLDVGVDIKELTKAFRSANNWFDKLKDATDKYESSVGNLAGELARAKQAQADFNAEMKKQAGRQVTSLINSSGAAKTLNELKAYAKQLKDTMANLDPKSKEWKKLNHIYKQTNREIKSINDSMKSMQTTQKSLINTADQLKRAFALMFSVSAIKGYVAQIAKVRGEFELQQRSLQAILQNKDEADKLWQQTVQLAIKSPFQVKELVTYTKQLAAYRVESSKLYDTTKMLADVSAGLGVDMSRLILAFGQVKAANYLRGTELRQFSEAGVNILGELAKYFTELEGRAVSVGEVFERVSKRMVTFTDVEEIFKRITSEGGIFYNMQEIQADTLKGQISNLRDSIDILLNEIGKDNEGVLKSAISTIRDILTNWREVEYVLKMIISLYAAYKVPASLVALGNSDIATSLFNIGKNGFSAANAMKNLLAVGKGLATVGVGAAVMAIVGVIIHLIRKSTEATRKLKALNKELNQIYTADTTSLKRQIDGFEN